MFFPNPICAICNKPVEYMQYDILLSLDAPQHRFTVRCHGQEEKTFLDDFDVVFADRITEAKAFVNSFLTNSSTQ